MKTVGATDEGSVPGRVAVTSAEGAASEALIAVPPSGVDLEAVERALIRFALEQVGGNRTRAARFLRLTRSALLYRMHKYGLRTAGPSRRTPESAGCDSRQPVPGSGVSHAAQANGEGRRSS